MSNFLLYETIILSIIVNILLVIWMLCLEKYIKKLTKHSQLSDKYIRRLKAVAKMKGCDLSDVMDDREGV